MPESVLPGDDDYTRLHAKWVKEGSPFQFDELGNFGGRVWKIHDRSNADGPTFMLVAASGPTPTGYEEDEETFKSTDWKPTSGFEIDMQENGMQIQEGPGGEGDIRLKYKHLPRDTTV